MNYGVDNHRELREDEFAHLENVTVRGGVPRNRPGYHWIQEYFNDPADQRIFQQGKYQGSSYYGFASGALFVYAVDGNLFGLDPVTGAVTKVNPFEGRPFSRTADFVYFEERDQHLICQDGINTPVILTGTSSRLARLDRQEVATGLMMADGWGYLVMADPDRRRLYISDHEADPLLPNPALTFTPESLYYRDAPYFTVPRRIGRITGVKFIPWTGTDTGYGPLAVFGETGVVLYDISLPRQQWVEQDISRIVLNRTGGIGHKAIAEWGNDLWFSDQHGRIRSIQGSQLSENAKRVKFLDWRVFRYYTDLREDPRLRRWRQMATFDSRVFCTILPDVYWINDEHPERYNVAHRGLIVSEAQISELTDRQEVDVWAGIWTGINPLAIDTGLVTSGAEESGEEFCLILSRDSDRIHRVYRLTKEDPYDITWHKGAAGPRKKQPKWTVQLRPTDFGLAFQAKQLRHAALRLADQVGVTKVKGQWVSDSRTRAIDWFTHYGGVAECMEFGCDLKPATTGVTPRIMAPKLVSDECDPATGSRLDAFYHGSAIFTFTGAATLKDVALVPTQYVGEGENTNVVGVKPTDPPLLSEELPPVVSYDALKAEPLDL